MKTHFKSIVLAIFCAVVFAGCQGTTASSIGPIRGMRLVYRPIGGQPHLFSTFGFWALDESLRSRLLGAYDASGVLNRTKLREIVPEAHISEEADYVRLVVTGSVFPEILLSDGWLLSLDPKFDQALISISEVFRKDDKRPPIIPLGLRRP